MQPIAYLVKVAIPDYLAGLPIPDTVGGWFRLGCEYFSILYKKSASQKVLQTQIFLREVFKIQTKF